LKLMHTNQMFSKMVFYLEACESGSMFDGLLDPSWNIYATTASNPSESSWGTYCPPQDMVDGTELNSCLGDLYSVNWMENTDLVGTLETLETQFNIVQNETTQSHVMQYGTVTWTNEDIGDFEGDPAHHHSKSKSKKVEDSNKPASHVDSRDVPMHLAYYRYLRSKTGTTASKQALAELRKQLDSREKADTMFAELAQKLSRGHPHHGMKGVEMENLLGSPATPVKSGICVKEAVKTLKSLGCNYDDYSLQYHKVIVNACTHYSKHDEIVAMNFVIEQIKEVCKA